MLDLSKPSKAILVFFFILIILPTIYARMECPSGTINQDDIPCYLLLQFNESNLDCSDHTISIYNETDNLYNQTMGNYSPFFCYGIFNETTLGTYVFQYDTGDTGSIIVEGGLRMIYLFYFGLAVAVIFFILGLWKEDKTFTSISGILIFILGVYIAINGFNELSNMLTLSLATVFWGLGAYIFYKSSIENM